MKKVTRIIGLMSLALVMAVGSTSCKKDNTGKNASFKFALPSVEGFSTGERAYIDPTATNQLKWWEGDQMMMYNLDKTNPANSICEVFTAAPGSQNQHGTTFSGNSLGARKDGGFFAFYPADKAVELNNNRGKFRVDAEQTIDPSIEIENTAFLNKFFMDPQAVVMADVADDFFAGGQNATHIMRHVFGFVNLRVKSNSGDKMVKSIKITDKKVHLTGPIEINLLDITDARLTALQTLGNQYAAGQINYETYWADLQSTLQEMGYTAEPEGFDVTLTCPQNMTGVQIDSNKKYFIIPLRPGALINGFEITVTYEDGTSTAPIQYGGQANVVRPGWFTNIDVVL